MTVQEQINQILAGQADNKVKAERIVALLGRRLADDVVMMDVIELILNQRQPRPAAKPARRRSVWTQPLVVCTGAKACRTATPTPKRKD